MYADIAPHDPDGTLQHEWLNSRGAIARFDRHAIEIRVLDVQECPAADIAICSLIIATLRRLVAEEWLSTAAQQAFATERLAAILISTIRHADAAIIDDAEFLNAFGMSAPVTASELWRRVAAPMLEPATEFGPALRVILEQGPLSRRILKRVANASSGASLIETYRELCNCLATGKTF